MAPRCQLNRRIGHVLSHAGRIGNEGLAHDEQGFMVAGIWEHRLPAPAVYRLVI
jgi:hypothetical protein